MIHDPLCPEWAFLILGECRTCQLIADVRADERKRMPHEGPTWWLPCRTCDGTGHIIEDDALAHCGQCDGHGKVRT
jgi:DnaJ-class molecular chaperone